MRAFLIWCRCHLLGVHNPTSFRVTSDPRPHWICTDCQELVDPFGRSY